VLGCGVCGLVALSSDQSSRGGGVAVWDCAPPAAAYYRTGAIRRRALERLRWEAPVLVDADEQEELERMAELEALRPVLAQALGSLPQKRRRAVELRIVAGLPYEQVAARLGCSEQAARASVSRGLRSLAKRIDQAQPNALTQEVSDERRSRT
jgi:DNA-directed RNA polymerase specialized sigma24 family protein